MRGRILLLLVTIGLLAVLPAAQAQEVSVNADLSDTDTTIDLCGTTPERQTSIEVFLDSKTGSVSTEEIRIDVVPQSTLPEGSTAVLSQTTFYADARPLGGTGPFSGTDKAGTLRLDFLRLAADEGCSTVEYELLLDAEAPKGSILHATDQEVQFVVSIGEPASGGSGGASGSSVSAASMAAGQTPLVALAGLGAVVAAGVRRFR